MLKDVVMKELYCDRCGKRFEAQDFTCFLGEDILDIADNYGWYISDNEHICDECCEKEED